MNWYTYCSNNPIVKIDPDGLRDRYKISQNRINGEWSIYSKSPIEKFVDGILAFVPGMTTYREYEDKSLNDVSLVTKGDIAKAALKDIVSFGIGKGLEKLEAAGDASAKVLNNIKTTLEKTEGVVSLVKDLSESQEDALGLRILTYFYDGEITDILPGIELVKLDDVPPDSLKASLVLIELYLSGKDIEDPSGEFTESIDKAWKDLLIGEDYRRSLIFNSNETENKGNGDKENGEKSK